jgi:hypothetical protein
LRVRRRSDGCWRWRNRCSLLNGFRGYDNSCWTWGWGGAWRNGRTA